MSGVKRTEDFHSLKTRSLLLQNADFTFPPIDSILVTDDSKGHVTASKDLNVNSLAINNDRALIDPSGNINAASLTLTSVGNALQTVGDLFVTNANIYNSGDGNATGSVQTTYVTLLDPSANNPNTYLYANSGSLLWQNESTLETINISESVQTLLVDSNYRDFELIQSNTDPNLIVTINRILTLFSNRQIFLDLSGANPPPIPPAQNTLSAYNTIFNSKSAIIIRIVDASGNGIPTIGDFLFVANLNTSSAQFTLTNICNNLTSTTNSRGSLLSDYVKFQYNTQQNPYAIIMNLTLPPSTAVVFLDVFNLGEAQRFLNHLLFIIPPNNSFGPPAGTQLKTPPPTSQYINYAYSGSITGATYTDFLKYPNNDRPLNSPTFTIVPSIATNTIRVNISAPPDLTGLTPPSPLQFGTGNSLQYYGVYLNDTGIWMQPILNPPGPVTFVVDITGEFLFPAGQNTLSVSSIDVYNETLRPTSRTF